jgi:hypothetical protein
MYLKVNTAQVTKNRNGIVAMWENIPEEWVDLNTYLRDGHYPMRHLLTICDGKDGPNNPCGAVGCFAGWNWTYHPYQNWCRKHKIEIDFIVNLDIYLGLQIGRHTLWMSRENRESPQREEVNNRLARLLIMDIYDHPQWAQHG